MRLQKHWSLGAKLALVGAPFLILVLLSTAATLWVSWQLDGGAAAVNEAGRMRMQSYRMSLSVATGEAQELAGQVREFNQSLETLRHGDPERPLFVPWDNTVRQQFRDVELAWAGYQSKWISTHATDLRHLRPETVAFAARINTLVSGI